MKTRILVAFIALTVLISGSGAGQQRVAAITFSETVAPIIYQNCVTCHRPGEAAPFSLITSGRLQTYVGKFDPSTTSASKGVQISTEPAAGGIIWRQDQKELYFLALPPQQGVMAIDLSTAAEIKAGPPRLMFKVPSPILAPAQLSSVSTRDGERWVFLQQVTGTAR